MIIQSCRIVTLAAFVLISGCKAANTGTESAESFSQISSSVSGSQITEFETKSDTAQESYSKLSAPSALSSEMVSEVNSKPAVHNRETKTESSAAEIKPSAVKANNNPVTSVIEGSSSTTVKNATAADTREVAD